MAKSRKLPEIDTPALDDYRFPRPTLIATFRPAALGLLAIGVIFPTLALLLLPGRLNPIDYQYPPDFENQSKRDQYLDLLTDQFATYFKSPMATDVAVRAESAAWRFGLLVTGGLGYLVGLAALGFGMNRTRKRIKDRYQERRSP